MNWRPIKTAPKDEHILLRYPSFSDDGQIVNQGHWIQYPHEDEVEAAWHTGVFPPYPEHGRWEVAYIAILEHGGQWDGYSYEERHAVVEPTHWMPLPKVR